MDDLHTECLYGLRNICLLLVLSDDVEKVVIQYFLVGEGVNPGVRELGTDKRHP